MGRILVTKQVTREEIDNLATGCHAREVGTDLQLGIREMARMSKMVPSYISDLEHGRRAWRGRKAADYLKLLERLALRQEKFAAEGMVMAPVPPKA